MQRYEISSGSRKINLELRASSKVIINGVVQDINFSSLENGMVWLTVEESCYRMFCKKLSEFEYEIYYKHHVVLLELSNGKSKLVANLDKSKASDGLHVIVKAPMPGLVTSIEVKTGDIVAPGKGLLILEAMKMENEIRSTVQGLIKSIDVKERSTVEKGQRLLSIEILP